MITNRSLIDARTYDGFRKVVSSEFNEIFIIDLGGDVRKNPKLSGTKHNVFGIQTGVCISFMIKNENLKKQPCKIYYCARPELETAKEKLIYLKENHLKNVALSMNHIIPDKKHNWLNITDNDFEELTPLASKQTKSSKNKADERTVFKLFSLGVSTNRDDWVYDFDKENLQKKAQYFVERFNSQINSEKYDNENLDYSIKWSRDLKKVLKSKKKFEYNNKYLIMSMYRPFIVMNYYSENEMSDILTSNHYDMFGKDLNKPNKLICFSGQAASKPFQYLAVDKVYSLDFLEKTQCLPLYIYN